MFGLHGMITPGQETALNTNGGLMYYQYNGNNTVSELTDRNGDEIEHYRYDAFGNILTGITAPYNSTTYTGQQYDDKAGLLYMNARWYNPGIGRFITQDTYPGTPDNPQSQNRYAYALNNPVNMWDPTGHVPSWVGDQSYLTYIDNGNLLSDAYILMDNYINSTGYTFVNEVKTATQITDTYRDHVTEYWDYFHLKLNYDTAKNPDTGETEYNYSGYSEDWITYSDSYTSTKTVVTKAAEIAETNKQRILEYGNAPNNYNSSAARTANGASTQNQGVVMSVTTSRSKDIYNTYTDPITSQLMAKLRKDGQTDIINDITASIKTVEKKFGLPQTGIMNGTVAKQLSNLGKKPAKKTPSNAKNVSTSTPITPGNSGIVKNANGSTTVWTEKGSFTYKNDQALTTSGEVITGAAVAGTAGIAWEGLSTAAIALYTKVADALGKYGETATKEGAAEADIWALKATERGEAIEEALSKTDYKDWYNIGQADNGYFKAIDFQKGNNVVSLKSIDPTLPSYSGNGATNKVLEYLDKLDLPITVDGKLANKILDVRIPQGTMNNLNMNQLLDEANQRGIKLIIKEFK